MQTGGGGFEVQEIGVSNGPQCNGAGGELQKGAPCEAAEPGISQINCT